ncbi:MAG: RsmB/NOP family class I SAM-dependent RNA methyltransferase [Alphaproteobacteria bacterium]|nr:RsmB/NOP family class I SAM-dependent RNA methyltransferase [Alphaproteobacteria bacterium]
MTPSARLASAIELLAAIDLDPRKPADAVANDFFRSRRFIGGADRRAVAERVWSALRARRRLAWWLARVEAPVTPRLLLAASLVLDEVAVETVAKSFSGGKFGPAPLVPAEQRALRLLEGHTLAHPEMPEAVALEVPDWLLIPLAARFGGALATELAALAEPAPLDLRVNLLKATREEAQASLAAEGVAAEPTPFSPWGLRVSGRRPITAGRTFLEGLIEIQDEGSQLVVGLMDARPGERVADWCAGAGGKTLALAMMMGNAGHIAACDTSAPRLEGAVRRLRRAGVHNVERHALLPGDRWVKRRAGGFDRVLVDAPCTGTGTWRRNPDARLRLSARDLAELLEKQARILAEAARLVRSGGRLVYATCSLLTEENEAQVQGFLAAHPEFAVLPLERAWTLPGAPPCPGPHLALTPHRHGTDGFFAAVLERRA